MDRLRQLVVLLLLTISTVCVAQQDPLYTQYVYNPAAINPAYIGTHNILSINTTHRKYQVGIPGTPFTNTITAHSTLFNDKMAAGLLVMNDIIGVNTNTEAQFMYSYKIPVSGENKLSLGLQGGLINYSYNYNKLDLRDANDASFQEAGRGSTQPNFGAGIFYNTEKLFIGVSVPRILNVEFDDGVNTPSKYKPHYYLYGGYVIDLNYQLKLRLSTLVRYVDGALPAVDLNGSVLINEMIWLGASLRNLNTAALMAQFQLSDVIKIGYAFDIPINSQITQSFGSHEITLNIDLAPFDFQSLFPRYF